jgi:alcohol dehydrogenase, propanol-preferring
MNSTMKAWLLKHTSDLKTEKNPLDLCEIERPIPYSNELLIKISCCGICHTELDEIEGRTAPPAFPVVPGHQVVGEVYQIGDGVVRFNIGDRVGVAWIYFACGHCSFCLVGLENLCSDFKGTGRDFNGGYSEFMTVKEKFACHIPPIFSDQEAAPLLCAGAIGYRALQLTKLNDGETLGLTGFGASAHLVIKTARYLFPNSRILVFSRSQEEQQFAMKLGASWAGSINGKPPYLAQAIIDTTPAWRPIVASLANLRPGGRLVINAIRKELSDKNDLLEIDYAKHIWMEKEIKSVANITMKDVEDFLALAAKIPIKPTVQVYPFKQANKALVDLKKKHTEGAKVLMVNDYRENKSPSIQNQQRGTIPETIIYL